MRVVLIAAVLLSMACETRTTAPLPTAHGQVEAGITPSATSCLDNRIRSEIAVRRLVPLMWGRHPHGAAEVALLIDLHEDVGMEALVRAMSKSPEYRARWRLFLHDFLRVARLNEQSNPACYARPVLTDPTGAGPTAALAEWVRDHDATTEPFRSTDGSDAPFSFHDLTESALVLDDLSPLLRANLFASLWREFAIPDAAGARAYRDGRVTRFMKSYLGRDLECMRCHNSEYSTTSDPDPSKNRFWNIEGQPERALFGEPGGPAPGALRPLFRRWGVVAGAFYDNDYDADAASEEIAGGFRPWGADPSCGVFIRPDDRRPEELGDVPYFITPRASDVTIFDLEAELRAGLADLRSSFSPSAVGAVSGPRALASLVATNLTNAVFVEATGSLLTIPHGFPRNQSQRDALTEYATTFATSGYSLTALLTAIATSELFTPGAYSPCFTGSLPALFDPWDKDGQTVSTRTNTVADGIHRLPARTLQNAVATALEWADPWEYPMLATGTSALVARRLGVFLKPADPGYRGINFQSLLSFEADFGACIDPAASPSCPLSELLSSTTRPLQCALCIADDADICAWDDRCCDASWRAGCPTGCTDEEDLGFDFKTHPPVPVRSDTPGDGDFVDRLSRAAEKDGVTVRDALSALSDRLLGTTWIGDADDEADLATLLGTSLDAPYGQNMEAGLRRACGVWLMSPAFQLGGLGRTAPLGPSRWTLPETDFTSVCERYAEGLFASFALTCDGAR